MSMSLKTAWSTVPAQPGLYVKNLSPKMILVLTHSLFTATSFTAAKTLHQSKLACFAVAGFLQCVSPTSDCSLST